MRSRCLFSVKFHRHWLFMVCRCLLQGGLFESSLINGYTILLSFISQERTLKIWVWLFCGIRCVLYSFHCPTTLNPDLFRHRWFFSLFLPEVFRTRIRARPGSLWKLFLHLCCGFRFPLHAHQPTRLLQNQPLKAVGKGTHQVSWIETASCDIYFSIPVPGTQQVVL